MLDPNVLVSALLSRSGTPAQIVARWLDGEFEVVVSELLLAELEHLLAYAKILARVTSADVAEFLALREGCGRRSGSARCATRLGRPGRRLLVALAEEEAALLVSGDQHLLALAGRFPIRVPRVFLETLERGRFA